MAKVEDVSVHNVVVIDDSTCTHCGVCVESCPTDVFVQTTVDALPEVRS